MPHTVGVMELNPKCPCYGVEYDEVYLEEYESSTSRIYFMNILGESRGCMYLWVVTVKESNLVKETILNMVKEGLWGLNHEKEAKSQWKSEENLVGEENNKAKEYWRTAKTSSTARE